MLYNQTSQNFPMVTSSCCSVRPVPRMGAHALGEFWLKKKSLHLSNHKERKGRRKKELLLEAKWEVSIFQQVLV